LSDEYLGNESLISNSVRRRPTPQFPNQGSGSDRRERNDKSVEQQEPAALSDFSIQ
jgi:hypothetical protein